LVGWILDSAMPDAGSGPLFSLLLYAGFYFEITLVSSVVYFLIKWGRPQRKPPEGNVS